MAKEEKSKIDKLDDLKYVKLTVSDRFRTDVASYFQSSGLREHAQLNHTPLIVIENGTANLCFSAIDLVKTFSDDADVFGQWRGQWSSDFFYFKVKTFKEYIERNPKKSYQQV